MAAPARRPARPVVRSSGGGKSIGTGIAISAVLLAAAAGAVLYTNSQGPINAESKVSEEAAKKKKTPPPPAPETPGRRLTTDVFSKEETIVPKGILTLVLSSDKKGQIEFEILPKDGPIDASMVRVKESDVISDVERATLREKLQHFEAGKPAVLRAEVLAGEVQYCQVTNPGDKPVSVTATGRTITAP